MLVVQLVVASSQQLVGAPIDCALTRVHEPALTAIWSGSSSLDSATRTLYVQLEMDAGTGPTTGMPPQYIYGT